MVCRNRSSASWPSLHSSIVVLKFGSSVLDRKDGLATVVYEIYREIRKGKKILAVVSALPGVTDWLLSTAHRRFSNPDPTSLARFLSIGETASAALLGMALDEAGLPAAVVEPERIGFRVHGPCLDAEPLDLDVDTVRDLFEQFPVVVLPGYFGRAPGGALALLGRGGSDLTALFAAHRLGAEECRLLKDVSALFPADPGADSRPDTCYASATWEETRRVGGKLVQPKAVDFARQHQLSFAVSSPLSGFETRIGSGPVRLATPEPSNPALKVSLLGLGTVGTGVYERLSAQDKRFQVVGVAVRDLSKHRDTRIPRGLLVDDPWLLLSKPTDVVVELMGGREPAASLIRASLEKGRHVVTGNKDVVAHLGSWLERKAQTNGVQLKYSASVGGAVPVLEQVRKLARSQTIERIEGVLNGTCNFILDRMAEGLDYAAAVREAQDRGFAESDADLDLSGTDSVHKLVILARASFDVGLEQSRVRCRGIWDVSSDRVRRALTRGSVIRLVATCHRSPRGLQATVRPIVLPKHHPLAGARGEENRILVQPRGGKPCLLSGKGAGRWPTSLAVVADLLDLHQFSTVPREVYS